MPAATRRRFWNQVLAWVRWLHIYLSMVGFGVIFFFAVTGITLNHPTWFGLEAERTENRSGSLPTEWLRDGGGPSDAPPTVADKLSIVERLRSEYKIQGALAEFRADDAECIVTFKGPGYAADAFIQRATGHYELTISQLGLVAIANDLHKGRDSGAIWSVVIDASALLMAVSSITGVLLLLFLRRHRWAGLVTMAAGCLLALGVLLLFVP